MYGTSRIHRNTISPPIAVAEHELGSLMSHVGCSPEQIESSSAIPAHPHALKIQQAEVKHGAGLTFVRGASV